MRLTREMTQQDLADEMDRIVGVQKNSRVKYIGDIENTPNKPVHFSTLRLIAEALRVDTDVLRARSVV
jgi:transcriptional regulator with XRE-family HTH domain